MIYNADESNVLYLGRPGENETTSIVFDLTKWVEEFGVGDVQLMAIRPGETEPYPVALKKTNTQAVWTTQLSDLFKAGRGKAQLTYYKDGKAVKSTIYTTTVQTALQSGLEPPEPYKPWLDQIVEVGAKAEQDAKKAQSYAVGGTDTRPNEETDNAKYYYEQTKKSETIVGSKAEEVEKARAEVQQSKEAVDKAKQEVDAKAVEVDANAKQVAQDKEQTGKDAKQTAEDAKQTKSDREQTGKDVASASTSASNAKTSEDNAKASEVAVNEKVDGFTETVVKATETAVQSVTAEGTKQTGIVKSEGEKWQKEITENGKSFAKADDLMKLAIKPQVQGNPIITKDSADFPVVSLELSGSTTQVQTTGKNLFDIEGWFKQCNAVYRKEGDKFFYNATGKLFDTPFVISEEDEERTLSFKRLSNENSTNARIEVMDKNGKVIKSLHASNEPIHSTGIFSRVRFNWTTGKTMMVDSIQIEKGSVATEYEPYSGGEPSPSPNYPQEVKQGEWDNVGNTGKNLLPPKPEEFDYSLNPYCFYKFLKNPQKCVIKLYEKDSSVSLKDIFVGVTVDGNKPDNGFSWMVQNGEIIRKELFIDTLTPRTSGTYFSVFPNNIKTVENIFKRFNIQIELGTTPTTYEPYKGFTSTIEPITLSKWDKVKLIDGVWCKENQTSEKMELTGNEEWKYYLTGDQKHIFRTKVIEDAFNSGIGSAEKTIYSNMYKASYIDNRDNNEIYLANKQIDILDNRFKNADDFVAFLKGQKEKGNPVIVQHKLQTPTLEPLPQATQDLLNKITTFYLNTILQTNDGITLDLQYVADTKLYIDEKLVETQALILER